MHLYKLEKVCEWILICQAHMELNSCIRYRHEMLHLCDLDLCYRGIVLSRNTLSWHTKHYGWISYMCHRVRKMCSQTGARTRNTSLTERVLYRLSYPAAWHIISLIVTKSEPWHTPPRISEVNFHCQASSQTNQAWISGPPLGANCRYSKVWSSSMSSGLGHWIKGL